MMKAKKIEELSRSLISDWKQIIGAEALKYYAHILIAHIPDFVARCPVDLMDASGTGIELLNQVVKRIAK